MPTISDYLKYASLQMAAEAFLVNPADGKVLTGTLLEAALTLGNNRISRFTKTQAQAFVNAADGWVVLAQQKNTDTGFSGTLFQNKLTDELVLSFRSTEFIDDAARDNQASNSMEISEGGWAMGQIADMENWFRKLNADPNLIGGRQFSVTGYSLGGHLATAFNLLHHHEGQIKETYTFNGAGVGTIEGPTAQTTSQRLRELVDQFDKQRKNVSGSEFDTVFSDAKAKAAYAELRARLAGGVAPTQDDIHKIQLQIFSSPQNGIVPTMNVQQGQLLIDAMKRVQLVMAEIDRLTTLQSGSSSSPAPKQIAATDVEATRLDYQLAVLIAQQRTSTYGTPGLLVEGLIDTVLDSRNTHDPAIPGFYDVFGSTYPSVVASSQLHYGAATPIIIEDQPLFRGDIVAKSAIATLNAFDFKSIVNGFANNDFGDTHSLALLVDSLSVQDTLAKLGTNFETKDFINIFKASSNLSMSFFPGSQGKAEGDVLENIVNSLADSLGLGWRGTERLKGNPAGNTWGAYASDQTPGFTDRTAFHAKLKALQDSPAYTNLKGKVQIVASPSDGLTAKSDFSALLSLVYLTPFMLKPVDAAAAEVIKTAHAALKTQWEADKALSVADQNAGKANFSDMWQRDRAALLGWTNKRNLENAEQKIYASSPLGQPDIQIVEDAASNTAIEVRPFFLQALGYADVVLGLGNESVAAQLLPKRYVKFGKDQGDNNADNLYGGASDDRLFGNGGNDIISGGRGDDYLEGNAGIDMLYGEAGRDTLLGGAGDDTLSGGRDSDLLKGGTGNDTYAFTSGDGFDTIVDADGLGRITYDGMVLGNPTYVASNVWRFEIKPAASSSAATTYRTASVATETSAVGDMTFTYMLSSTTENGQPLQLLSITGPGGGLVIRGWQNGQLGITLPNAPLEQELPDGAVSAEGSANTWFAGTHKVINASGSGAATYTAVGAYGEVVFGTGTLLGNDSDNLLIDGGYNTDDILKGNEGNDSLIASLGDDRLYGGEGVDAISGGAGDDLLDGGEGHDVLSGGLGEDVLIGGDGDDYLNGGGSYTSLKSSWSATYIPDPILLRACLKIREIRREMAV